MAVVRGWVEHAFEAEPSSGTERPERVPLIETVAAEAGIVLDDADYLRLFAETRRVLVEAADRLEANEGGDYSPDTNLLRFPPVEVGNSTARAQRVTLSGLVEEWWREAKAGGMKPATHTNYRGAFRKLVTFLGHDDATKLTAAKLVEFKDHRLNTPDPKSGKPVSPRTVKDNDLAALKSVLGWAVSNHKLPTNPALGITVTGTGKTKVRKRKGFQPEEIKALLNASRTVERRGQESAQSHAVKRWVPWLLAYTGARVGEIIQLRRRDIQQRDDHWVIVITPDAGTVKTDEEREVPIHPHLAELGFLDFVFGSPHERLFLSAGGRRARSLAPEPVKRRGKRVLTPSGSGDTVESVEANVAGKVKGAANHLREFIHEAVPNLSVQPNHGWRHLFETRCRQVGVEDYYQRVITGHSFRDVHESYGEPAGLYREICRLPRFEVDEK